MRVSSRLYVAIEKASFNYNCFHAKHLTAFDIKEAAVALSEAATPPRVKSMAARAIGTYDQWSLPIRHDSDIHQGKLGTMGRVSVGRPEDNVVLSTLEESKGVSGTAESTFCAFSDRERAEHFNQSLSKELHLSNEARADLFYDRTNGLRMLELCFGEATEHLTGSLSSLWIDWPEEKMRLAIAQSGWNALQEILPRLKAERALNVLKATSMLPIPADSPRAPLVAKYRTRMRSHFLAWDGYLVHEEEEQQQQGKEEDDKRREEKSTSLVVFTDPWLYQDYAERRGGEGEFISLPSETLTGKEILKRLLFKDRELKLSSNNSSEEKRGAEEVAEIHLNAESSIEEFLSLATLS